ncbi:Putative pre-16S rRNA nuclease [Buchnera aphidicola (Eriosoma grossulariae)]|uniref:Holliday junction resolvase RuvX n=1 Tax=Buchnera aphidicola TaxID=9 RepID=UPI0034648FD5
MFIIAFDFGTQNIGLAVGQKITLTAQPLTAIPSKNGDPNWDIIKKILFEWNPMIIIVGLPLNMDGSKQEITYRTEIFAQNLKNKFHFPVKLQDERLSTIEAKSILFQRYGFKSLIKNKIDSISAMIILESWLNNN